MLVTVSDSPARRTSPSQGWPSRRRRAGRLDGQSSAAAPSLPTSSRSTSPSVRSPSRPAPVPGVRDESPGDVRNRNREPDSRFAEGARSTPRDRKTDDPEALETPRRTAHEYVDATPQCVTDVHCAPILLPVGRVRIQFAGAGNPPAHRGSDGREWPSPLGRPVSAVPRPSPVREAIHSAGDSDRYARVSTPLATGKTARISLVGGL